MSSNDKASCARPDEPVSTRLTFLNLFKTSIMPAISLQKKWALRKGTQSQLPPGPEGRQRLSDNGPADFQAKAQLGAGWASYGGC
jgi:hypothetical protein